MSTITDIQVRLQTLTNKKITFTDIGNVLGTGKSNISLRAKNNSQVTDKEIRLLENAYNVNIFDDFKKNDINNKIKELQAQLGISKNSDLVNIPYRPDVYLSAGYGIEVYEEAAEFVTLDVRLFTTDRGVKINPAHCEIVRVSGNSMEPEYRHGDRVIINRDDTEFLDGHIFAFRYNGQCYVKEINVIGDKIKCISLNKEYEPFYIHSGEEFTVFGRILPRIRL